MLIVILSICLDVGNILVAQYVHTSRKFRLIQIRIGTPVTEEITQ